ncbi:superoxide dismutase [Commensalibacter communis]|uniref:superoxide dismutase n=1 Tax=Commensalibacter communis TaxID=2972786 RepID=UPI0022FF9D78|nr:superoxide dismutase [Commensalibacter communis]CAI3952111.1 Superoxide dismutase (SodA) (PDB:1AP5) [Commensalibacter communis]CAI3954441.1 Superoxide dismutase (SodA) (PDB:1AP5) [Commensalibacter communis]
MAFELGKLPYPENALSRGGMSEETIQYHYGKHHQTYVNTLNDLVAANPALQGKTVEELIVMAAKDEALTPVLNNAGQHYNHTMFWNSLSPTGGKMSEAFEARIVKDFGSVDNFKTEFKKAATTQFGSGWAWLVLDKNDKLVITKTPNAKSPLSEGQGKALLVADVWEHAYYIDFRNRRPDFIDNFLNKLANYDFAEQQLNA